MPTATFCQEVPSDVTQQEIDDRVQELKTLGGAVDAYAKTVGDKRYICAVREVFDEVEEELTNPDRAGPDKASVPPQVSVVDVTAAATGRGSADGAASGAGSGGSETTAPGSAGDDTTTAGASTGGRLTDADYRLAAQTLGCEPAAIRAVAEVESGGRTGFLADGRPKILFESHIFSKLTGGAHNATHPDISTAKWTRNYIGGAGEYDRLERAMRLNREAALKSASWGKFQIVGMNHALAGFDTVEAFVEAQERSEQEQLKAFVNFILSNDLSDELHDRRWADFARKYNGPGFAKNRYDEKMAEAYTRYA